MRTALGALSWQLLFGVAVMAAASCSRSDTPQTPVTTTSPAATSAASAPASAPHRDEALVRVIQLSPSHQPLDLFAGDLLLFDNLGYQAVTPYRALEGQRYVFMLRPTGQAKATPLSSNTEGLTNGGFYTAIAMPGDGDAVRLRVINDPLEAPAAGKARVRVVNAAIAGGEVGVQIQGSPDLLFSKVAYQDVSGYRDVAPDAHVEFVDDAGRALAPVNGRFAAGRSYTVVLAGSAQREPRLAAFAIEDKLSQ